MSLCRYLPSPSDRMGVIWTLLSVKGAVVLEYGPAGTTHFSVGMYGALGVEPNMSLFTTHLSEEDVIMGDVTRLEDAIVEIDSSYAPEAIFVVPSSVTSVIGTDIIGVCTYMNKKVRASLVPVDIGGFKGDYTLGMREGYNLLVKTFAENEQSLEKCNENTYNILGASGYSYRMKSDIWEIASLMQEAFGYTLNATLGFESSTEQLTKLRLAQVNLVLRAEALPVAKYMEEKYKIPYVYAVPYGYEGTAKWLESISQAINVKINSAVSNEIKIRMTKSASYKMYAAMYAQKGIIPKAVVAGDFDQINGLSSLLEEINLPVELKIANHSLAGFEADDIIKPSSEKEKIDLLREVHNAIVFGDDITHHMCDDTCEKVLTAFPLINHTQIANHLPLMGIRGMDYLLESISRYYDKL